MDVSPPRGKQYLLALRRRAEGCSSTMRHGLAHVPVSSRRFWAAIVGRNFDWVAKVILGDCNHRVFVKF
jgi:hypothetical protein